MRYDHDMLEPLPRPRILFEAVPDEAFSAMKVYAPTHERIDKLTQDSIIHDSDWDLLVTFSPRVSSRSIPHTLAFGAQHIGLWDRQKSTPAIALGIPSQLTNEIQKLVRSSVVPTMQTRERPYWRKRTVGMSNNRTGVLYNDLTPEDLGVGDPLLTAGEEGFILSFWNAQDVTSPQHTLVLPEGTLQPEAWLDVLITRLQDVDPVRFPPGIAWRDTTSWAPPKLRLAYERVDAIEAEREQLLSELENRLQKAQSDLSQEKRNAEDTWWRLLTGTGDILVGAVKQAFEELNFLVEDRDESKAGAKLEDLRITDPDDPNWICLTEVKGYSRGAKSNDVTQVAMNPAVKFAADNGRAPDKLWHVVNVRIETSPEQRGKTFSDPETVLATFTKQGGLVIDTRDLVRAVFAVIDGSADAAVVRESLKLSSGLWSWSQAKQQCAEHEREH